VDRDSLKNLQVGMTEVSRFLLPIAILWLLGSIGLGWLVKSFFILLALILIAPIVAYVGFRWWLSRSLMQSNCPVCGFEFAGLNQTEFRCPNCGEPLRAEHGQFKRLTPPGTIDVTAVEVPAQSIEE
jgi:rubredoxin